MIIERTYEGNDSKITMSMQIVLARFCDKKGIKVEKIVLKQQSVSFYTNEGTRYLMILAESSGLNQRNFTNYLSMYFEGSDGKRERVAKAKW